MRLLSKGIACFRRLRGFWNHKRALSLVFLVFVAVVASATFPKSLVSVGEVLQRDRFALQDFVQPLDDMYSRMLNYDAPLPVSKAAYIDLNGLLARAMGQRYVNERVKLGNGHLSELAERVDVTGAAAQITELYRRQQAAGKTFLFVLAPTQIPKYQQILPAGYEDFSNENGDHLMALLRENGVTALDLRDEMRDQGRDHDASFFVTDHHWRPETGFWVYTRIMALLTESGAIPEIDARYTDLSAFDVETYPRWYLGSGAERTGQYYAGLDDFSVITPAFDTHMTSYVSGPKKEREGTFKDVAIDWPAMSVQHFYKNDPYLAYNFGVDPYIRYNNAGAPIEQKVLFLGDSNGNTIVPFLALAFREVEDIDLRYRKGSFAEYYEKAQPDIIVMEVYTATPERDISVYRAFPELEPGD